MNDELLDSLEASIERLNVLRDLLKAEDLNHEQASTLVQECAELASTAVSQLERLSRSASGEASKG